MGLLQPVNGNERQSLKAIIESKNGPRRARLKSLTSRILRRYKLYAKHSSDLALLSRSKFQGIEREDCEHCYHHETTPLSHLKEKVVAVLPASSTLFCPLCGLSFWDTFDHFAPKSVFPEFSVLPKNLVPCCWKCNHLKGDSWLVGQPLPVLNVYFDKWPQKRFLEASVDFDPNAGALVTFSLARKSFGRIPRDRHQKHFERLKLDRRFAAAGASAVDGYRRSLSHQGYSDRRERKRYLRQEAGALAEKHGPNHWESVLLDALADCDAFLDSPKLSPLARGQRRKAFIHLGENSLESRVKALAVASDLGNVS